MSQGHGVINMVSDLEKIQGMSFDYIIVGGGTSGCPLAATLSERFTVLLVERGGSPFEDPLLMEKKNFMYSMSQINELTSTMQKFVSEEGVENLRGRVLGGSTAINGGVYSRTTAEHITSAGWDVKLVKEAYEWVESKIVFEPKELSSWQSIAKDVLVDAGVVPFNGFSLEHTQGTKLTGTIFDENEKRHCSAHLLEAGDPSRLTVLLNATVKNILFCPGDGGKHRACGIRFISSYDDSDISYDAYLNQESDSWGDVVLCAGAIGSPQILMLSGIGPQEHLNKLDIAPILDAPKVGQDISDNPAIFFKLNVDQVSQPRADPSQVVGITEECKFLIQLGCARLTKTSQRRCLLAKLSYPRSRGKLELSSTDPRQNPSVRFNYLVDKNDLDECVEMIRKMKKVAKSIDSSTGTRYGKKIDNIISEQIQEGDVVREGEFSQDQLRQFCKMYITSYLHSHGGCNVGSVVDEDYKVYGVEGLRVVDASILSDQMATSPMGTLLMLGRYQGVKMLSERGMN